MANVKCPSCGSPNVEQIDIDTYQCPYCGSTFKHHETPVSPIPQNNIQPQSQQNNNNQIIYEDEDEDKPSFWDEFWEKFTLIMISIAVISALLRACS